MKKQKCRELLENTTNEKGFTCIPESLLDDPRVRRLNLMSYQRVMNEMAAKKH